MSARVLQKAWHIDASSQTIRNRLKEQEIKSYSTTKKPHLSSKTIQQRLEVCKKYESWSVEDWKTVVFSMKQTSKLSQMVDTEKYGENQIKCLLTSLIHQGSSQHQLWYGDAFLPIGMGDFHILEGRLKASDYIEILEQKLLPFTSRVFPNGNFSFQQDNAPCHTAHTVSHFLRRYCNLGK